MKDESEMVPPIVDDHTYWWVLPILVCLSGCIAFGAIGGVIWLVIRLLK